MSAITTHILDVSLGKPAAGVRVILSRQEADGSWKELASGETDADGRQGELLEDGALTEGVHRLRFEIGPYFEGQGRETFYPHAEIVFRVADTGQHYHVPLLVSPFGYSTYRGS